MDEYTFRSGDTRASVRYRKTAWYLTTSEGADRHTYRFPLKPDVKGMIKGWNKKEIEGAVSILLTLPHEEIIL